jgi:hypothetical protein
MVDAGGDVTECFWPPASEFTEAAIFQIPHDKLSRDQVSCHRVKLLSAVRQSPETPVQEANDRPSCCIGYV